MDRFCTGVPKNTEHIEGLRMIIKVSQRNCGRWFGFAGSCIGLITLALTWWPGVGWTSPIPGVKAVLSTNGTLSITVTNGVTNEYYTIYTQDYLDTNIRWSGSITGAIGQTNFSVTIGQSFRFFRAESGIDRDGDGIENYRDADPNRSNINYALRVIIENPVTGSTLP